MSGEALPVAERAAVLRALHQRRDEIVQERERLILLDHHMSTQEKLSLTELTAEASLITSAINWLWRQV